AFPEPKWTPKAVRISIGLAFSEKAEPAFSNRMPIPKALAITIRRMMSSFQCRAPDLQPAPATRMPRGIGPPCRTLDVRRRSGHRTLVLPGGQVASAQPYLPVAVTASGRHFQSVSAF